MPNVLLALWSYNSQGNYGSDWKKVVNSFRTKVEATTKEMTKHADHATNVLKGKTGDFHVVVSDWAATVTANMVAKAGGHFLHASSNPAQTCVYNGVKVKSPRRG